MADISKIQIESGTYNIKDEVSRNKLKEVITPEMFGAKGDGVTDDTLALQQFLNDSRNYKLMNKGSVYLISAGLTYHESNSDSILDGNYATIKIANNITNFDMLYIDAWNNDTHDITIKNLNMDGNKSNIIVGSIVHHAIRIFSGNNHKVYNIKLINCNITDCKENAIGIYNDNSSVDYLNNVIVDHCKINNCTIGICQSKVSTTIKNCHILYSSAENITVDNGCSNCYIENCLLEYHGHGGNIGLDEATNIYILNNIIDGYNDSATSDFKNGLSFNSHTGNCENIIVSNNIFKNHNNAISIGTVSSQGTYPVTVKKLNIVGNDFISNVKDIYVIQSNNDTRVYARSNAYSSGDPLGYSVNQTVLLNGYNIDIKIPYTITTENNFTVVKNNNYIYEGVCYLNSLIQSDSASISEGWKSIFVFPFQLDMLYQNYDIIYNNDGSNAGYKEVNTYSNTFSAYWIGNESIKKLYIKLELPVYYG
jgi:hypothetical protein